VRRPPQVPPAARRQRQGARVRAGPETRAPSYQAHTRSNAPSQLSTNGRSPRFLIWTRPPLLARAVAMGFPLSLSLSLVTSFLGTFRAAKAANSSSFCLGSTRAWWRACTAPSRTSSLSPTSKCSGSTATCTSAPGRAWRHRGAIQARGAKEPRRRCTAAPSKPASR
jgi:hypothetical protein